MNTSSGQTAVHRGFKADVCCFMLSELTRARGSSGPVSSDGPQVARVWGHGKLILGQFICRTFGLALLIDSQLQTSVPTMKKKVWRGFLPVVTTLNVTSAGSRLCEASVDLQRPRYINIIMSLIHVWNKTRCVSYSVLFLLSDTQTNMEKWLEILQKIVSGSLYGAFLKLGNIFPPDFSDHSCARHL